METVSFQTSSGSKDDKGFLYRLSRQIDWILIASVFVLITYGLVAVYSAASRFGNPQIFYIKQLTALGIGFFVMVIIVSVNYRLFRNYAAVLYILSLIMLILVLFFGIKSRGARSWFDLVLFTFQPSELTKIAFILILAAYLDKFWMQVQNLKTVFVSLAIMFVHIVLILLQPDFSSCLVYFPVLLGMLYVAGAKPSHLWCIMIYGGTTVAIPLMNTFLKLQPGLMKSHGWINFIYESLHGVTWQSFVFAAGIVFVIFFIWWLMTRFMINVPVYVPVIAAILIICGTVSSRFFQMSIKEYQQKRLIVFLNPDIDPLGSGYNIKQSKIAIGSGKFIGKGYMSGTQARLGFIPEQHTDFIFSVISEEFGFLWAGLLLVFYGVFIYRILIIAEEARDRYGSIVASGIACMFIFYVVINVGMVMGIMPVTGLPLPFVSYGGSSLLSALVAVGILVSIHIRRYTH